MKRNHLIPICMTVLCLGGLQLSYGSDLNNADAPTEGQIQRETLFNRVQVLTFAGDFDRAAILIDSYLVKRASDAAGWLARSGLILAQMSEDENDSNSEELKAALDSVLVLAEVVEDSCSDKSAMHHLLRGHAHTYRAIYESKFGFSPKGIKYGYQAMKEYESGLRCDSTFYDLYFGLGGFHYWKSAKAGLLKKVGLFDDDREQGLKELTLAIDSSRFSSEPARNALISIYLDQKEYDSALAICSTMLERYPNGTIFLWPRGVAYHESGQPEKCAELFGQLREHYSKQPGNYFNMVECDYMITKSLETLELKKEAAKAAAEFSKYEDSLPRNTLKRQSDKIRYLKWWARKAEFY
ncbi:MAG: hypothetical protein P1R58_03760 [bacterium]|nr:hypothetical protein [bacterium]